MQKELSILPGFVSLLVLLDGVTKGRALNRQIHPANHEQYTFEFIHLVK